MLQDVSSTKRKLEFHKTRLCFVEFRFAESSLHRKNQVDVNACELCRTRCKRSLLRTILDRAKRLS